MSLTLLLIERDARLDAGDLEPAPNVVVLREQRSEAPSAFAERVSRSIDRMSAKHSIDGAKYFVGHVHGEERLDSRTRITKAVLSAAAADVNVSFIAHGASVDAQIELFSLLDSVRSELALGISVELRFFETPPAELRVSA